jgi:hypothetical protein
MRQCTPIPIRSRHWCEALGVGDTLEYQVSSRTLKPNVPGQFWLGYSFQKDLIVLEGLDLGAPADKAATVTSADVQPTITTSGVGKQYRQAPSK